MSKNDHLMQSWQKTDPKLSLEKFTIKMCSCVTKTKILLYVWKVAKALRISWQKFPLCFIKAVRKSRLWFTVLFIHLRVIITVNFCLVACWVIKLSMAVYWPYCVHCLSSLWETVKPQMKLKRPIEEAHPNWSGFAALQIKSNHFQWNPICESFSILWELLLGLQRHTDWLSVCRTIG